MDFATIIITFLGSSVFSSVITYLLNRKKTETEVKSANVEVDQKVQKFKDDDRINAYEEKEKLQESLDKWVERYNDLNQKMALIIEENTKRAEERYAEREWRRDMENKYNSLSFAYEKLKKEHEELKSLYNNKRCDNTDCTKRIPPIK